MSCLKQILFLRYEWSGRKMMTICFVLAWCLLGIIISFVLRDKEMITATSCISCGWLSLLFYSYIPSMQKPFIIIGFLLLFLFTLYCIVYGVTIGKAGMLTVETFLYYIIVLGGFIVGCNYETCIITALIPLIFYVIGLLVQCKNKSIICCKAVSFGLSLCCSLSLLLAAVCISVKRIDAERGDINVTYGLIPVGMLELAVFGGIFSRMVIKKECRIWSRVLFFLPVIITEILKLKADKKNLTNPQNGTYILCAGICLTVCVISLAIASLVQHAKMAKKAEGQLY